eukprot:TRINITY_DN4589_c0_g2_i1.p1 TRINITY_DN4589_c0_g2~~TRINITY_DN4589_c0_g2_i1.p1  ORF type:complete len:213 (+),score=7.89 TRINITY_DN4589_c0_g2_i1:93-731(+)
MSADRWGTFRPLLTPLQSSSTPSYFISQNSKPTSNTVKCILGYRLLIVVMMLAGVLIPKGWTTVFKGRKQPRRLNVYCQDVEDVVDVELKIKGMRLGMVVDDPLRPPGDGEIIIQKQPKTGYVVSSMNKRGVVMHLSAARGGAVHWTPNSTPTERWAISRISPGRFQLYNTFSSKTLTFSPQHRSNPSKRWRLTPSPCPSCAIIFEKKKMKV